ncbi:uncharacterized protein ISCGN_027095 [Ixodes scapularis]
MTSVSVWSPALKSSIRRPHLDINFMRVTRVSQVEVLYVPGSRRVSHYSLLYSDNGKDWYKHGGVRTLNYKNSVALDRLEKTIQARQIRFVIEGASDDQMEEELLIGLQMELYGCYIEELDQEKGVLDPFVNYLLGFDPESGRMLACDSSGDSFLGSSDGVHWALVPGRAANGSLARATFVPSLTVPAMTRSDILSKDLIIGDWKGNFSRENHRNSPRGTDRARTILPENLVTSEEIGEQNAAPVEEMGPLGQPPRSQERPGWP